MLIAITLALSWLAVLTVYAAVSIRKIIKVCDELRVHQTYASSNSAMGNQRYWELSERIDKLKEAAEAVE